MPRAVVIVPCYNEASRLDVDRFARFVSRNPSIHLLLVDDGSRDSTLDVLHRLQASNSQRIGVLALPQNGGKAEAVRRGMLMALREQAQYVGFWDADLATPLEDILSFCSVLDAKPAVEAVIGVRLPLVGHAIERRPLRKAAGRVFAQVAGLVLGVGLCDTQCGAKLFRAGPQWAEMFAQPFRTRWIFDVELFARWISYPSAVPRASLGAAVYEYPLDRWRDVAGSKLKSSDFVTALWEIAVIYWTYLRPGLLTPAVRARLAVAGRAHEPAAAGSSDSKRRAA